MPDDEREKEGERKPPSGAERPSTPYGTPQDSQPTMEVSLTESSLQTIGGRFALLAELGRGGMGIVYRARDRETNEIVALKVLKPEIACRPELIERFKSELRLARKITHKNVCRTYDLHRFGDTVVIAMEYVEGDSLRQILARYAPLSARKGTEWAGQICAGLAEAHAQGVIHRDLKPENIQIDQQGVAKVMDFGIARSIETAAAATGTIAGTPAYMSPEQAEGKPGDARSDLYSLGLILYEMFTGRPALKAETPLAYAHKQIHETPPPPREVEPSLPPTIEEAILRCIAKDPAKRFATVSELLAALSRKIEAPLTARLSGLEPLPPAIPAWIRNRDALLSLIFLVIVSVMLANVYLSKLGFVEALGVIFNMVVILFVWPRLRRFRAIFWAGMTACAAVWLLAAYILWRVEPLWLALLSKPGSLGPRTENVALAKFILGIFGFLPWLVFAVLFPRTEQVWPKPEESTWQRMERAWPSWMLRVYNSMPFGVVLMAASALLALWLINGLLIDPLARLSAR